MTVTCPRCARECVRKAHAPNVYHYDCPDPDCEPEREARWRFALGLTWECAVLVALLPVVVVKAVWRRVPRP